MYAQMVQPSCRRRVVDMDPGTGKLKVRRFIAVDDCGVQIARSRSPADPRAVPVVTVDLGGPVTTGT
jgi:hypothetical protein